MKNPKLKLIKRAHVNLSLLMITSSCFTAGAIAAPIKHLEESWYVGGATGYSLLDPKTPNGASVTDDKALSAKVYAGFDVTRQLGLEAFWADMGSSSVRGTAGDGKIKYSAIGVNAIYHLPLYTKNARRAGNVGRVHPFGKLGLAKINTKTTGTVVENKQNDFTIFGGVGAVYDVSDQWKVRAEYDYYTDDISQLSVGVNWSPKGREHYFVAGANKPIPAAWPNNMNVPKSKPLLMPRINTVIKPVVIIRPVTKPVKPAKKIARKVVQTHSRSLSGESLFATGSARLSHIGLKELDNLVNLTQRTGFKLYHLTISGHTDNQGSRVNNIRLSKARAESVAHYLESMGIRRNMMSVVGYGESQPIASNTSTYGRSKNRRVEIKVKGAQNLVTAVR